jgi:hypothetical protein
VEKYLVFADETEQIAPLLMRRVGGRDRTDKCWWLLLVL